MSKSPKKVTRRSFLKYAGLTAGATVLSACAAPTPEVVVQEVVKEVEKEVVVTAVPPMIKKDTPIVIGTPTEDAGLWNPMAHCDFPNYFINRALLEYDHRNGTYDVIPGIAKSYEVLDDGLRYRMHLRDNVFYHSGDPYEAEHSKWYLEMFKNEDHELHDMAKWRSMARARNIDKLEVVDKYTLDVFLTSVFPAEPDWLASYTEFAPHNPATIKRIREKMVDNPDGVGPYKVLQWDPGSRLIAEKHDKFYDPEEGLASQLIFRPITETQARLAALEAGEVHWAGDIPVEEALRLATTPGLKVSKQETLFVWYITLDIRRPPLDDVRVRQALNYAVDKEALIRDILGGAGARSYGPLGPNFGPYYPKDHVIHYDYNPDKARDLLAEAGFPNGFDEIDGEPATIYGYTGRIGAQKPVEMCAFIQAQWKDVGVNVEINIADFASYEAERVQGKYPMAVRGWTPSSADPDGLIYQNFHGEMRPPNGRNVTFLNDDEVNSLLDKAMSTIDIPVRIQAMLDAQKRIADLAPWVFIDHEVAFEAYTDKIRDYNTWGGGRAAGLKWAWLEA